MSMPSLYCQYLHAPAPLTRKRSWTEMSHVASDPAKRAKSTLAASRVVCDVCQHPLCVCGLSDETQRFLAQDPFDFDALPHPVLQRQQAVQLCGLADDSDLAGQSLGLAPTPTSAMPRWNASIVGASLAHAGRALAPRRM